MQGALRGHLCDSTAFFFLYQHSVLPEILDCSFQWGCDNLRTPANFGEGEAGGVSGGTVRKSVGEFL